MENDLTYQEFIRNAESLIAKIEDDNCDFNSLNRIGDLFSLYREEYFSSTSYYTKSHQDFFVSICNMVIKICQMYRRGNVSHILASHRGFIASSIVVLLRLQKDVEITKSISAKGLEKYEYLIGIFQSIALMPLPFYSLAQRRASHG